jgi:hypothetical protein
MCGFFWGKSHDERGCFVCTGSENALTIREPTSRFEMWAFDPAQQGLADEDEEQTTRIISVRRAIKYEKGWYNFGRA